MSRRTKKWIFRAVIAVIVLFILGILAYAGYLLTSRSVSNDYRARVQLSFNAAQLSGDGLHVKAGDDYHALNEDSYRRISFYMMRNAQLALGNGRMDGETIELRIGDDPVRIVHDDDSETSAIVHFETGGKSYRMVVHDTNFWREMRRYTGEKYYLDAGDVPQEEQEALPAA